MVLEISRSGVWILIMQLLVVVLMGILRRGGVVKQVKQCTLNSWTVVFSEVVLVEDLLGIVLRLRTRMWLSLSLTLVFLLVHCVDRNRIADHHVSVAIRCLCHTCVALDIRIDLQVVKDIVISLMNHELLTGALHLWLSNWLLGHAERWLPRIMTVMWHSLRVPTSFICLSCVVSSLGSLNLLTLLRLLKIKIDREV